MKVDQRTTEKNVLLPTAGRKIFANLSAMWSALSILLLTLGIMMGQVMVQLAMTAEQLPIPAFAHVYEIDDGSREYPLLSINQQAPSEQAHQERIDPRILLANVPQSTSATSLTTTNYQEDRAVREALLAKATEWSEESSTLRRFTASNRLQVYLSNPNESLAVNVARDNRQIPGEHTVLTARILLGLWQSRHNDSRLSQDRSVVVRVNEILQWRGVQKHQRIAYPGAKKRFTDGYQWKHKQQVYQDMQLLSHYYLRGYHTVVVRGQRRHFPVDGSYLHISPIVEQTTRGESIMGYMVAPGNWLTAYEEHNNLFLANMNRAIFQLHPQNDQLALRMALYLTECWRQQARSGNNHEPITMQNLLLSSMIAVDKTNLTTRFAPRVEAALHKLYQQGILGETPTRLSPLDKTRAQWGKDWLASSWSIVPSSALLK